jgi:ankyrin repeat protein
MMMQKSTGKIDKMQAYMDHANAVFEKAKRGDAEAQFETGKTFSYQIMGTSGRMSNEAYQNARMWLTLAAKQDHQEALTALKALIKKHPDLEAEALAALRRSNLASSSSAKPVPIKQPQEKFSSQTYTSTTTRLTASLNSTTIPPSSGLTNASPESMETLLDSMNALLKSVDEAQKKPSTHAAVLKTNPVTNNTGAPSNYRRKVFSGPNLLDAAKKGEVTTLSEVLDSGVSVNYQDNNGWSALHFACEYNQPEIVNELISRKANLEIRKSPAHASMTPLHVAAYFGRANLINLLTAAGANPKSTDASGHTALDLARSSQNAQAVQSLQQRSIVITPLITGDDLIEAFDGTQEVPQNHWYQADFITHVPPKIGSTTSTLFYDEDNDPNYGNHYAENEERMRRDRDEAIEQAMHQPEMPHTYGASRAY